MNDLENQNTQNISDLMNMASKDIGVNEFSNKEQEKLATELSSRIIASGKLDEVNSLINSRSSQSSENYLSNVKIGDLGGDIATQMSILENITSQFNKDGTMKPERKGIKKITFGILGKSVETASNVVRMRGNTMNDQIIKIKNTLTMVSQRNREQAQLIDTMIDEYSTEISNVSVSIRAIHLAIKENEKKLKKIEEYIKNTKGAEEDVQVIGDRKTLIDMNERYEVRIENLRRDRISRMANYMQIMNSRQFFLAQADNLDSINESNIPTLSRAIQQAHLLTQLSDSTKLGRRVQETTNKSMEAASNATLTAVIDVAESLNRPSIEINTLKKLTDNYKKTQTRLTQIKDKVHQNRSVDNKQMEYMEGEIKQILINHGQTDNAKMDNDAISHSSVENVKGTDGNSSFVNMDRYVIHDFPKPTE